MKVAYLLFILILSVNVLAQDVDSLPIFDYTEPNTYEIAGIKVVGNHFSDEQALLSMTGLQIGNSLKIPSGKIQQAMKALWKVKLFSDVTILVEKTAGNLVFLKIEVTERPRLSRHSFKGAKKTNHDDLNAKVNRYLLKGTILTEDNKANAQTAIKEYYREKGFFDTEVRISEIPDTIRLNSVRLVFDIKKGQKVKIKDIAFTGNQVLKSRRLRKLMKDTKEKKQPLAGSKFIPLKYKADKVAIIQGYQSLGYRDAKIQRDSFWRDEDGLVHIAIEVAEGRPYYFGNIVWKGNAKYSAEQLDQLLAIEKGDTYHAGLLEERLRFSENSSDISSIYMDDGYLFFRIDPVEIAIRNDTIDLELRMMEGPQATIDKVVIKGNDRTHEHVIRRELRTVPGDKFSRTNIMRSQREIVNLGYFNPENLDINTPVNPNRGTVDIEYTVEERQSDQLELSAGWGGQGNGIIGSLGFTFTNFSLRHLFDLGKWDPLPKGDGQRLSVRMQSNGRRYQALNLSFTEPWLGGKTPTSFTVAGFLNRYTNGVATDDKDHSVFLLSGGTVSIGKRLRWPDDFFVASTSLNIQVLSLKNWNTGLFATDDGQIVSEGNYNNFSITQTLARNSVDDPLFPTRGSKFSLSVQFTPPYSLFSNKDYADADNQEKYKWIEYHKWRFNGEYYAPVAGKLTLKVAAKMGYVGFYNQNIGISPFERFQLGGDGLNNQAVGFQGTDIISLRGYEVRDLAANILDGQLVATPLFQKFTTELRYPLSTNPNSTIYLLAFAEAGNAWRKFDDYSFFDMKRSVGFGARIFLPMFGLLGFDYGFGLDKTTDDLLQGASRGRFSIILGFEPE